MILIVLGGEIREVFRNRKSYFSINSNCMSFKNYKQKI